jgi:hypothetical protein
MACALLFFAPGNNQLWRVAEWLVQKANSERKVVAVREAVAVLPAAVVVVSPEVAVARVVVVDKEAASQAAVVVDKEAAASQAAAVVDRAVGSLVAVAAADREAAVRAVVVVDARAAAGDKVAGDKAVGDKAVVEAAGPAVEAAADPLVVVEWEAEARVAAVAVPPVVAAAETAKPFDSGGASRICGAPLFY